MDFECIMLSEISKMEKDKYCIILLIAGHKKRVNKKINEQTKQNENKHKEQSGGYQ